MSEVTVMTNWAVYMVRCADGSLYTGITTDVERRLAEHNGDSPSGARYTRARRPVSLVYREDFPGRSEAAKREAAIKGMKKGEKETLAASFEG